MAAMADLYTFTTKTSLTFIQKRNQRHCLHREKKEMRILLVFFFLFAAVDSCSPSDRAALLAFKAALKEPYLGIFNTWTTESCCVGWYGISCDPETLKITDINLRSESEDPIFKKAGRTGYMTGSISPEVCKLDRLTTLIIADWKGISGEIPKCLTKVSHLRVLDLAGNNISGIIPSDIGNLNHLTMLNLADNAISSTIPPSIVNIASLMHLDLRNNQITGEIPSDFGKLGMLSRALLSSNQLSGTIPTSITKMDRLADLDLSMNRISGSIPENIGNMPVLATLNLDNNRISGQIPPTLINGGIGIVNLSRNALEGKIPDVFSSNSDFIALDLSFNALKGPIPKSMSSAKFFGYLDMSHNHLCGSIPIGLPLDHLEASSFTNNDCLCGNPLKACEEKSG